MRRHIVLPVLLAGMFGLSACGDPASTPPPVPVECVEPDGEPCDEDPLDLDDLFEKHKTAKPTPKPAATGGTGRTPATKRRK